MVNTQGKRRSTPPSRRRYEASHPTVSFRVDLDLYAELKALKQTSNLSVADILKVGLGKCEQYMVITKDLLILIFHNLMENILLVTAVEEMKMVIIGLQEEWTM